MGWGGQRPLPQFPANTAPQDPPGFQIPFLFSFFFRFLFFLAVNSAPLKGGRAGLTLGWQRLVAVKGVMAPKASREH